MSHSVAEQHSLEVEKGERFQFGRNWKRFLGTLTDEKISQAEKSLEAALSAAHLDGKSFLDVGSGSGLFSLAARRLGAKVHSFDYDPNSVACTKELQRRYFPADDSWTVEQGSVLDRAYLASLGVFDVVYSWGVLHHTGQMWTALDNVKPLVKRGGHLYIAVYNELGAVTDRWRTIKRTYNRLPSWVRWPFAMTIIASQESRALLSDLRHRSLKDYLCRWSEYPVQSRGMSKWYDSLDWIGGYPYECATLEGLIDFFGKDGFALEWLESRAHGIGCNETVFRRKADLGIYIDNPIRKSRFLLRRFGRRVIGPFQPTPDGYLARLPEALAQVRAESTVLFRDGMLVGPEMRGREKGTLVVAPPDWPHQQVMTAKFELVPGRVRQLASPFMKHQGHMFSVSCTDLKHLADDMMPNHDDSPLYVFEDKQQLEFPHALHTDIVKFGTGRFSHWREDLLFSSSDNSDPNSNGRVYELVIVDRSEKE